MICQAKLQPDEPPPAAADKQTLAVRAAIKNNAEQWRQREAEAAAERERQREAAVKQGEQDAAVGRVFSVIGESLECEGKLCCQDSTFVMLTHRLFAAPQAKAASMVSVRLAPVREPTLNAKEVPVQIDGAPALTSQKHNQQRVETEREAKQAPNSVLLQVGASGEPAAAENTALFDLLPKLVKPLFEQTSLKDLKAVHALLNEGHRLLLLHSTRSGKSHYSLLFKDAQFQQGKISWFNPTANGFCVFSNFVRLVQLNRNNNWLTTMKLKKSTPKRIPGVHTVDKSSIYNILKVAYPLIARYELDHMNKITDGNAKKEYEIARCPEPGSIKAGYTIEHMHHQYASLTCAEGSWIPKELKCTKCIITEKGEVSFIT